MGRVGLFGFGVNCGLWTVDCGPVAKGKVLEGFLLRL